MGLMLVQVYVSLCFVRFSTGSVVCFVVLISLSHLNAFILCLLLNQKKKISSFLLAFKQKEK